MFLLAVKFTQKVTEHIREIQRQCIFIYSQYIIDQLLILQRHTQGDDYALISHFFLTKI